METKVGFQIVDEGGQIRSERISYRDMPQDWSPRDVWRLAGQIKKRVGDGELTWRIEGPAGETVIIVEGRGVKATTEPLLLRPDVIQRVSLYYQESTRPDRMERDEYERIIEAYVACERSFQRGGADLADLVQRFRSLYRGEARALVDAPLPAGGEQGDAWLQRIRRELYELGDDEGHMDVWQEPQPGGGYV